MLIPLLQGTVAIDYDNSAVFACTLNAATFLIHFVGRSAEPHPRNDEVKMAAGARGGPSVAKSVAACLKGAFLYVKGVLLCVKVALLCLKAALLCSKGALLSLKAALLYLKGQFNQDDSRNQISRSYFAS